MRPLFRRFPLLKYSIPKETGLKSIESPRRKSHPFLEPKSLSFGRRILCRSSGLSAARCRGSYFLYPPRLQGLPLGGSHKKFLLGTPGQLRTSIGCRLMLPSAPSVFLVFSCHSARRTKLWVTVAYSASCRVWEP